MKLTLVLSALFLVSCAAPLGQGFKSREHCEQTIELYRPGNPPERDYVVIEIIDRVKETSIIEVACKRGADAIVNIGSRSVGTKKRFLKEVDKFKVVAELVKWRGNAKQ